MMPFLKLIRFPNILLIILTQFLVYFFLLNKLVVEYQFLVLALSLAFIAAGGNMINDYFDLETDLVNKPEKVIVNNGIPSKYVLLLYGFLTFTGIFAAFYISFKLGLILFLIALFLFLYSWKLKKIWLAGNLLVAFLMAAPVWISCFYMPLSWSFIILVYILFSFLSGLIREIVKDAEDMEGDALTGAKTLPVVSGLQITRAAVFCCILLLLLLLLLFTGQLIVSSSWLAFGYFCLLDIALVVIGFLFYKAKNKNDFHGLSKWLKYFIFAGIISISLF